MADPDLVENLRGQVASLLNEMADATDDARFRSAAAMLKGKPTGRRQCDDSQALDYARALLATKIAPSVYRACTMAAVLFAPSHQVETMRDRLRKKFRTKLVKSED